MSSSDPISIRQLEIFVILVEKGSFTEAARHLGLGQSTVSGHLADLEKRLGVRLLERGRGGVTTTSTGRQLLPTARQAVRAERRFRLEARELGGLVTGTLVVGGSTIPSVYLLPKWLRLFRRDYPGVRLDLRTGDSAHVLSLVETGHVDVGLIGLATRDRSLRATPIADDELVLIVSPDHPFATRERVGLEEVAGQPMVAREEGSGTQKSVAEKLRPFESSLDVVCRVGTTEAAKAFVRSGLGVSFVSGLAVADEVRSGALVAVRVEGFDGHRRFHLVTRGEEHLTPAGRAFRDLVLR